MALPPMLHQFLIPYNLYLQQAAHERMMMAMLALCCVPWREVTVAMANDDIGRGEEPFLVLKSSLAIWNGTYRIEVSMNTWQSYLEAT